MMCRKTNTTNECNALKEHIKQLEKEKEAQKCHIRELEEKNARLNALLVKKRKGQLCIFTLVQIVDYCKGCVEWADVKPIVMMLNKLLRRIGKEKDYDLVDSIEVEFKMRRNGDTHIDHQTMIPHIENYYSEVDTVENKFPSLPPYDYPTKQIK